MSRVRSIKPTFWTDEALSECSMGARLLFIATWTFADDHGNLDRSAKQLKAQAFPYDSVDVEPFVGELLRAGVLVEYEVEGRKYLHIKGFAAHQIINRPSKPRVPRYEPSLRTHGGLTEPSRSTHSGREGKGRERKGVEGKGVFVAKATETWLTPWLHEYTAGVGAITPGHLAKIVAPVKDDPQAFQSWRLWCSDGAYRVFARSTPEGWARSWRGVFDDVAKTSPALLALVCGDGVTVEAA